MLHISRVKKFDKYGCKAFIQIYDIQFFVPVDFWAFIFYNFSIINVILENYLKKTKTKIKNKKSLVP